MPEGRDGLHLLDRVYVSYADDDFLHERLLLSFLGADEAICASAHYDVYAEHMQDWAEVYFSGPRQGIPQRWNTAGRAGKYIRFDLADLETRLEELQATAEAEGAGVKEAIPFKAKLPTLQHVNLLQHLDFRDPPADATGAPAATKGKGKDTPAPPAGVTSKLPPKVQVPSEPWIIIETRGSAKAGDVVDPAKGRLAIHGDRGVFEQGGICFAVAKVDTWTAPDKPSAAKDQADLDVRTFPLAYSGTTRVPSYAHNVTELSEESSADDWTITGPRTTKWLLDNMRIQELQPVRRHWWWRQTLQINSNSEGCDEHLFISELLEAFVGFDGINLAETQA